MKNNKGSILFYILSFFVFFLIFFESAAGIKIKQNQLKVALEIIDNRLGIESLIISYYKNIKDIDEMTYQFSQEHVHVTTIKNDNKIKVNLSGAITHTFYYVIMEDGSFIFTNVEEKYDNIK